MSSSRSTGRFRRDSNASLEIEVVICIIQQLYIAEINYQIDVAVGIEGVIQHGAEGKQLLHLVTRAELPDAVDVCVYQIHF